MKTNGGTETSRPVTGLQAETGAQTCITPSVANTEACQKCALYAFPRLQRQNV